MRLTSKRGLKRLTLQCQKSIKLPGRVLSISGAFISKKINNGKEKGVIVETKGQKASVLIPELAMIAQVKFKSKVELEEEIKLKVVSTNLFERSVDFKPL